MADDDPYVTRGRAITTGGSDSDASSAPDADPYVARGRAVTAATPPPATTAAQPPTDAAPSDTIAPGLRSWIAPAPNTTYGAVLPLARDEGTGEVRIAMPSSLRDFAGGVLDLLEGPATGTVTPAATNALAQIAMAGRVAPSVARGTGTAIAEAAVPKPAPEPPSVTGVSSPDPAKVAVAKAEAGPTSTVPPQPTPPPQNMPSIIANSGDAKAISNAWYKIAESKGTGTALTPQAADKMIDAAQSVQQTEAGKAVAGDNAVTGLQSRLQALKGKPLTLQSVQEMDEAMTGLIDKEYGVTGLSKVGAQLQNIQQAWRNTYGNVGADDVTGGSEGFAALQPARQAWSTAMKMQDLERMQARAEGTQNPTSSFKTQVNNFVNSAKSRGWSDDEIAALKDAADRGAIGGALHVLGSRLLPHVGGAVGATLGAGIGGPILGPLVGFGTGEIATHVLGGAARTAANALQASRIANAYRTLGEGAPAPPPGSTFAPTAPSQGVVNPLLRAVGPVTPMVVPPAYQQGRDVLPNALWPGA